MQNVVADDSATFAEPLPEPVAQTASQPVTPEPVITESEFDEPEVLQPQPAVIESAATEPGSHSVQMGSVVSEESQPVPSVADSQPEAVTPEVMPVSDDIEIGVHDGMSELERAEQESGVADDSDVSDEEAFLQKIRDAQKAQAHAAGLDNPFLMKKEADLPVPTTPMPTLDLLAPARQTVEPASEEEL
jgi:S-DNA-T family DNA segregation ATPase FtsK/SpoIIIE